MAAENPMTDNLKWLVAERHLRRADVEAVTGLSRSSLYAMMATGEFPRPIRIGKRAVAWSQSSVEEWLKTRPVSQGSVG